MGDISLGFIIGKIYFALLFSAKDLFTDRRARSVVRKLMKLEIVNRKGEIASPYLTCLRNIIECLVPISFVISDYFYFMFFSLSCTDFLFMLFLKRRIMDMILGTRVVQETENFKAVDIQWDTHFVESPVV